MPAGGRLGIVAALPAEAQALLGFRPTAGGLYPFGAQAVVAVAGMGPERARVAAERLRGLGARALVSWGTCGALEPALCAGTAVIPSHVLAEGAAALACDPRWHAAAVDALVGTSIPFGTHALLSVPAPVSSPAEKRRLGEASGAAAIDMESYALASLAARARLPFLVLRTVVDRVDQGLPVAALAATGPEGQVDLARLIAGLARRPGDLVALVGLGLGFRVARRALRAIAVTLGPALASPAVAPPDGD